jgi:CDP-diacylglycerol--serine O-phosphatidyltransferase
MPAEENRPEKKTRQRERRQAYILVLPSLFTTGNLFCGFYAIVNAFSQEFEHAAYAILMAGVFDLLDGRVARITRSQSKFGMEYDSIADVISFGIAPALLVFVLALRDFGRVGFAVSFFYAACGALRLARFNTVSETLPRSYFIGLPIPAAANAVATLVIGSMGEDLAIPGNVWIFIVLALGLLMVSTVRYRSFKDFDLRHRRTFPLLVLLVAMIAFVIIRPELALPLICVYYAAWGVLREGVTMGRKLLVGRTPPAPAADKEGKGNVLGVE